MSLLLAYIRTLVDRGLEQQRIVEELKRLGWRVQYDYELDDNNALTGAKAPDVPSVLQALLGRDAFCKVVSAECDADRIEFGPLGELSDLKYLAVFGVGTISDEHFAVIARLRSLEKLVLFQVDIRGGGIERLAGCENLRTLEISYCSLSSETVRLLHGVNTIETLRLEGCGITDNELADLRSHHSIHTLVLCGNAVTDEGLMYLRELNALQRLDLSLTDVTDAGLVHLRCFSELEYLGLRHTAVTAQGLASLSLLGRLRELDIEFCDLDEASVAKLKVALGQTKILIDPSPDSQQPAVSE